MHNEAGHEVKTSANNRASENGTQKNNNNKVRVYVRLGAVRTSGNIFITL
jgi:hypothetical protein